ncbi:MAG TPA: EAL domain-containing protein [Rhodoferax sp.]|nr:EAL domain-containing protein [Rhodoferax sp.]
MMPAAVELLDAHILVVDDKPANVVLLAQLLAHVGYRKVSSTSDPAAVCALHRTHQYDLILLDLQMPGMDGFEVMAGLREIETGGYLPVLAITVQAKHKLRALKAGARDFIVKPFYLIEMETRIKNHLEVRLLYKELAKAVSALESYALHDALTGLPNRRLLLEQLALVRGAGVQSAKHGALMFLDLDHFKQLNDTLGHEFGDVLLQQVSQRLQGCLRQGDSVARFGGDEFVVLLDWLDPQPATAAAQAQAVAQQILAALDLTYNLQGHAYANTISIGVVIFQGEAESISNLLKKADLAMYRAKSLGRNRASFFDASMQAEVQARDTLLHDMRCGLDAGEFLLHYQLQMDAAGSPVGAEALLRWQHPQHGLMLPGQFLELAQDSNLILPLSQWVLRTACAQLLQWAKSPQTADWTLAINVGACQLTQADFVQQVLCTLQASGAPATRLTLELTEGTLLHDVEDVIDKMNALRSAGVRLCLDDFGVGFTSLGYLRRLPLAQIKLDQAMVHAASSDSSVAVLARAIVDLGASLGVPVIAEGIETAAQRDYCAALGCAAFQGNYFAAPAVVADLPVKIT